MDFSVGISTIHDTRKVEEMGTLVKLCPKSSLESLLGVLKCLGLAEKIEMGQNTKDVTRHTSRSEDVEELHSLHLKTIVSVNHEKDDVSNLCDIDHSLEFVGTLDKSQALLLGSDDRDGTLGVSNCFLGISSDERLHQSRLSYTGRANNGNESRRGLIGQSVDERDMETLFFDLLMVISIVDYRWRGWEDVLHLAISRLVFEACRAWQKKRPLDCALQQR